MNEAFRGAFALRLATAVGDRTHDQFAREAGICRPTLTLYLSGKRVPSAETLYRICKAAGCSADWLLGLEEFDNRERRKS